MKIAIGYPPNFKQIKEILNPADNYIFTYGDTIYSPKTAAIPRDILVHEMMHEGQQKDPKKWWDRYLKDPQFRLEQETEAYQRQWEFVKNNLRDREMAYKMLVQMARDLSSKNYGNLITFSEAMEKIKNYK